MSGWSRVTESGIVANHKAILYGVILTVSVSGAEVKVYDGTDATSGRQLFTLQSLANASRPYNLNQGVVCERGIYVEIGDNVTELFLVWDSLPWDES